MPNYYESPAIVSTSIELTIRGLNDSSFTMTQTVNLIERYQERNTCIDQMLRNRTIHYSHDHDSEDEDLQIEHANNTQQLFVLNLYRRILPLLPQRQQSLTEPEPAQ